MGWLSDQGCGEGDLDGDWLGVKRRPGPRADVWGTEYIVHYDFFFYFILVHTVIRACAVL